MSLITYVYIYILCICTVGNYPTYLELVHHVSSLAHNCCSALKVKVLSEEEKDCWPLQRGTIFPLPLTADVCLTLWYVLLPQKRNLKCWGLLFCLSPSLSLTPSLSLGVLACRVERASADQPSFSACY